MGDIGPVQQRYEVLPVHEPAAPEPVLPPTRPRYRFVRLIRKTAAKAPQ